jgi:hypothetical protein
VGGLCLPTHPPRPACRSDSCGTAAAAAACAVRSEAWRTGILERQASAGDVRGDCWRCIDAAWTLRVLGQAARPGPRCPHLCARCGRGGWCSRLLHDGSCAHWQAAPATCCLQRQGAVLTARHAAAAWPRHCGVANRCTCAMALAAAPLTDACNACAAPRLLTFRIIIPKPALAVMQRRAPRRGFAKQGARATPSMARMTGQLDQWRQQPYHAAMDAGAGADLGTAGSFKLSSAGHSHGRRDLGLANQGATSRSRLVPSPRSPAAPRPVQLSKTQASPAATTLSAHAPLCAHEAAVPALWCVQHSLLEERAGRGLLPALQRLRRPIVEWAHPGGLPAQGGGQEEAQVGRAGSETLAGWRCKTNAHHGGAALPPRGAAARGEGACGRQPAAGPALTSIRGRSQG